MAYMFVKNERYFPFDNLGDNPAGIGCRRTDGFDIDTLLAYPISILNNKGYKTLQCCEGHPLSDVYYKLANDYKQSELSDSCDRDRIFEIRRNLDGENYVCFEGYPITGAFVIFADGIELKSIPSGWDYREDNSIRWDCESYINPTDYYKKLIFAIESLTDWAENMI